MGNPQPLVQMGDKQRRRAQLRERLTPCECCEYPLSQRHHALGFTEFGENKYTRQLCANCHELLHIIEQAFDDYDKHENPSTRSVQLFDAVVKVWGKDDARIDYLCALINLARQGQREMRGQLRAVQIIRTFASGGFEK